MKARFPFEITSSDTHIPTSRSRKLTPKPGEIHRRPRASRLDYQSLITAARSRDGDPLTGQGVAGSNPVVPTRNSRPEARFRVWNLAS
jgi:hypothetical protein